MNTFIYTEVFNCGLIGKKCLDTFFRYHPDTKLHVVGNFKDFKELGKFKNIEYIDFTSDEKLKNYYKTGGHLGTAYIFTKVLKREYGNYDYVIHFDSDVVFNKECISDIKNKFDEGCDLVGTRRPYKNNVANKGQYNNIPDVVNTYFFGYNVNKVTYYDFSILQNMIVGYYNPFGFNAIDFFDPISFDIILKNNGKIGFLDFKKYGSCDENGSWDNGHLKLNKIIDFGENLSHFAGIGSGRNFFNNGKGNVPSSYADWAIKRYAMYMKLFYKEDIGIPFNEEEFFELKNVFCYE